MLIIDLILLTAIIVCVVYCWVLNRRIQDLQNSRIEFARMIKELNISIMKAESSISDLDTLSKITTTELKSSIEDAKNTASELVMINDISNNLADQLGEQISLIKKEQKNTFSNENSSNTHSPSDTYFNKEKSPVVSSEDEKDEKDRAFYVNKLKNFLLSGISHKSSDEANVSMTQSNYYDTLRKISVKK